MTVVLDYPSASTYVRAIQIKSRLAESLRSHSTRDSVVAGLPQSFSGANAIVFPMDDGQESWALRLFTNANAADSLRYSALEKFQDRSGDEWTAKCRWVDRAIRVGDDWFPGLRMELIEGVLLDQYVLQLAAAEDSASLRTLADDWRRMLDQLQASGFAHGDLQHGNVLVEQSTGSLRLVDFDGIWLEELAEDPPSERGHGSYQHPGRTSSEHWGPLVDTFGGLLVYLTLKALAADPALSRHAVIGSHLLLAESELQAVSGPDAPVLTELTSSPDDEVSALAKLFQSWLAGPPNRDATLEDLVEQAHSGPQDNPSDQQVTRTGPRQTSPLEWWQQDGDPADGDPSDAVSTTPVGGPHPEANGHLDTNPSAEPEPTTADRPLPSIGDIQGQVAMANSQTTPPAKPGSGADDWIERAGGTPTAQPAPTGSQATTAAGNAEASTGGPASSEIAGRRMLAALVDATVGMFLLLHLVWLADGEVPGKRAGGLAIRRTSGGLPGFGRLVVRELLLKQAAVNLVVIGVIVGNGLLVALSLCWLLAGGISGLGPDGRAIWDFICDTKVVAVEELGASQPGDRAEASQETKGGEWW